MSDVETVLAEYDGDGHALDTGGSYPDQCAICFSQWPCPTYRLAADLARARGELQKQHRASIEHADALVEERTRTLREDLAAATARAERYEQGLRDVLNPVAALQRDLTPGHRLNGSAAAALAGNPSRLRAIAKAALAHAEAARG